jgi:hypothetical protein
MDTAEPATVTLMLSTVGGRPCIEQRGPHHFVMGDSGMKAMRVATKQAEEALAQALRADDEQRRRQAQRARRTRSQRGRSDRR